MTPPPGILLGIDFGHRHLGVALSDELGFSTEPVGFIARQSDAQAATVVAQLAVHHRAVAIVLGLPLNADGSEGKAVRLVRAFGRLLAQHTDLPLFYADERYTSEEAHEALRAAGEKDPPPGRVDAKAAAIILRRHLDAEDHHGDTAAQAHPR
ncbi:MAG: Holliday junction resolvase RuvX [Planctomycetota bacterium]